MKAMLLLFATCLVTPLESYGSEEHAKKVFVEVLRDDSELRLACAGFPLELIVD